MNTFMVMTRTNRPALLKMNMFINRIRSTVPQVKG